MEGFRTLTSVFSLGLSCGIFSKEMIIQWCDQAIEAKDNVPFEIIEVSLMSKSKIDDIENKLFELTGHFEVEHPAKLVLSIIYDKVNKKRISIENGIRYSTRLLTFTRLSFEGDYYSLYSMDDSYDCAKSGFHSDINDVITEYLDLLDKYQVYFEEFKNLYFLEMGNEWRS
ncbi:protein kinase [Brevibacillus panacihumi]|uniref:protein kinase n=1 Tax=Brevibacillus panacihumi TaxID=497735 RepID=UPI003D2230D6